MHILNQRYVLNDGIVNEDIHIAKSLIYCRHHPFDIGNLSQAGLNKSRFGLRYLRDLPCRDAAFRWVT